MAYGMVWYGHIALDTNATTRLVSTFHGAFPELATMNAEFAYAYIRQLHYLQVAELC